jgi:integrase
MTPMTILATPGHRRPAAPTSVLPRPAAVPANPFTATELDAAWSEWSSYSPVLADVLLVLARTGLRWNEARALTLADATDDALVVDKAAGEGGRTHALPPARAREVPLAGWVRPIVARLVAGGEPDDLLFTTGLGGQLRRGAVLRRLNWAQTGRGRSLDDLRHTAACLWLSEGFHPAMVRHWLGQTPLAR